MFIKRLICFFFFLSFFCIEGSNKDSNLVKLDVKFFPIKERAVVKIPLGSRFYSLFVDLGSSHPISLSPGVLANIREKIYIGEVSAMNIKGDIHSSKAFQLPTLRIGSLCINNLICCSKELRKYSRIEMFSSFYLRLYELFYDWLHDKIIDGAIGLPIFQSAGVVLLDFPNSSIFLADHLQTLPMDRKQFISFPIVVDNYGVFAFIDTDLGLKKFYFDTGATKSVIRSSLIRESLFITKKMVVNEYDLGAREFIPIEFTEKLNCDGILGIDFFRDHTICIDFVNNVSYIFKK